MRAWFLGEASLVERRFRLRSEHLDLTLILALALTRTRTLTRTLTLTLTLALTLIGLAVLRGSNSEPRLHIGLSPASILA